MPIEILNIPIFVSGIRIIAIILATIAVNNVIQRVIVRNIRKRFNFKEAHKDRADTLIDIFSGTSKFIISILALLLILPEFGINIAALLAGIGVLGLAVSLAAQGIVTDFLSGIFIIIEDQYMIGDKIRVTNVEGVVREISLRRTLIEDDAGVMHAIPNGQIKNVAKISHSVK